MSSFRDRARLEKQSENVLAFGCIPKNVYAIWWTNRESAINLKGVILGVFNVYVMVWKYLDV